MPWWLTEHPATPGFPADPGRARLQLSSPSPFACEADSGVSAHCAPQRQRGAVPSRRHGLCCYEGSNAGWYQSVPSHCLFWSRCSFFRWLKQHPCQATEEGGNRVSPSFCREMLSGHGSSGTSGAAIRPKRRKAGRRSDPEYRTVAAMHRRRQGGPGGRG